MEKTELHIKLDALKNALKQIANQVATEYEKCEDEGNELLYHIFFDTHQALLTVIFMIETARVVVNYQNKIGERS